MAIELISKIKPKNNGTFPMVDAADVEMPDGSRLSDFKGGVTSVNGQTGDVTITATNGKDGKDGKDGSNGKDGVSPTVSVTAITGGNRVTITDANGAKSFDVMDGENGNSASITVDSDFSVTSENPVQNKVITAALNEATQVLGELYETIEGLEGGANITVDSEFSDTSENPVQNKVITAAMGEAMEVLGQLYAAIPTEASINALIDVKLGVIENGTY